MRGSVEISRFVVAVVATVGVLIGPATAYATDWLQATQLSTHPQSGWTDVAMQPDGDLDAVWWEGEADGVSSAVRTARRPAGGSWTVPVTIAGSAGAVEIATNAAGDGVMVWETVGALGAATRSGEGEWSDPVEVDPTTVMTTPDGKDSFAVAIDAAGNALAAWIEESAANYRVYAAYRPAGGPFGDKQLLSPPGNSREVDIAFDEDGTAIVAWRRNDGTAPGIEISIRPAGGSFSAPTRVSEQGVFFDPEVVTGTGGAALATWSGGGIHGAYRPPGGAFGAAETIDAAGSGRAPAGFDADGNLTVVYHAGGELKLRTRAPGDAWGESSVIPAPEPAVRPSLAINDAGDMIVGFDVLRGKAHAIARPAGGEFGPAVTVQREDGVVGNEVPDGTRAGIDVEGNGVVGWWRRTTSTPLEASAHIAGYDAVAPRATATGIPTAGTAGVPVAFSVSAFDMWSLQPATWDFGDGLQASGDDVSHTFAQPGTYSVTATLADMAANTRAVTGSITIAAAPAPPAGPPGQASGGSDDSTTAPTVTDLLLRPSRFRAADTGPSALAAKVPVGTTVSYRLDRAASVRFTIRRASRGRRVGRKCRAQTRRNRAARRCTRFVKVKGGFTRRRAAGADSFRFNGRLRGKALRVGRYRMIATPLDDGHTGNPARRAFRIAPSSARG